SSAAPLTMTIRNTGNTDLTGLAVSTSGSHPSDFIATAPGATTLAPDATTTFTVTFTPTADGPRAAQLQIASNDADENPFDIELTGTGLPVGPPPVVHSAAGYRPGANMVMTVGIDYVGQSLSALGYSLQLPAGWSYVSDSSAAGVKPTAGETGTIEWAWLTVPADSLSFSVTLQAPSAAVGDQTFAAGATLANAQGSQTQIPAAPNPLSVPQLSFHTVDVNSNNRYELTELLSVISLYNYRDGTTRTGEFYRDGGTYPPGPGTQTPPYRSTDLDQSWRIGLTELLSDISLYNYREGTVRTGEYHYDVTSGRFVPGPAPSGATTKGLVAIKSVDLNATLGNLSGPLNPGGGVASLQVSLEFNEAQTSSLGVEFGLPPGWSLASEASATALVKPDPGQTGALEWAWSGIPTSPIEFVVVLNYPPATPSTVITGRAIAGDPGGDQSQSTLSLELPSDPYFAWADIAFAGAPAGVDTSPTGNPDLDSLNNLLEYALGLDPMVFDLEVLRLQPPSGTNPLPDTLELSYKRPAGGVPGFTYTLKSSIDLSEWQAMTGQRIDPIGGGRERIVHTVPIETRGFYILEATRP
ncbi:MAG: choice-of-anchor D domain-containing protein, partial [Verrucomicrobiae bacterium]|nr:choice-of-anchor D domain-containing protein [Verrucomicrobiae bacterium]